MEINHKPGKPGNQKGKFRLMIVLLCLVLIATGMVIMQKKKQPVKPIEIRKSFSLNDFYGNDPELDRQVESWFNRLSDRQKIAQMIVPAAGRLGKPDSTIQNLVRQEGIGGVLLLNGSVESFSQMVGSLNQLAEASGKLPLLFSADAEPSLINRKITGSPAVPKTADIQSIEENNTVAKSIAHTLREIGIRHNYAPVSDVSPENEAIRNRSYGWDHARVISMNKSFVEVMQQEGIAATLKHFPGHGLVKGDSHHKLVYIDGEMEEIPLYESLISTGVISIMVGHIAVKNNETYDSKELPASCSPMLVNELLKKDLGFKGLVVTDAMNMGAVAAIPDAALLASKAGCDIILMPKNERSLIDQISTEIQGDIAYKQQVYASVKKIIKLKICLDLL
ncbi:MAG: glycoside hydrolase family 3 protein [Cyclobacteriaceae bacterium]|nr:glycoside hydrolase family 3 protein [Cyclobacteriaceae bacterium]